MGAMITVENLAVQFGGQVLFTNADLSFTSGNCYGIIGANGAGKSTFLRVLSGEVESSAGAVHIDPKARMSVLKQNQELYNEYTVMDTVIMGNRRLYDIGREKDAIYEKPDFTDEDGLRASELEEEFAELGGWEAESDAGRILGGLGVGAEFHYTPMAELDGRLKVKVLLAQALFGKPDIVLLDEPTNNLDLASVVWLEDFLMDYEGTVLVVSHDRYFLNNVCTHIVDIDLRQDKDVRRQLRLLVRVQPAHAEAHKGPEQEGRPEDSRARELHPPLRREPLEVPPATSRRKLLDKLSIEELPASSRRYPWVGFKAEREPGKDRLFVTDLSKSVDGVPVLRNVSFIMNRGDKIAVISRDERAVTLLFKLLMGEAEPDSGTIKWGVSTTQGYMPRDNSAYFEGCELSIMDWMRQFSADKRESYLRQFLGRMLFSGDEVYKPVNVLSGGERVRCMISKLMLSGASVLLLDQPTNHLDLESIAALNNGLAAFEHNVIFSCHDHQLTQTVANRIIEINADGSITDRQCSYDEYVHLAELEAAAKAPAKAD